MPHANIWIRVEDWEKWKSIKDVPCFIHAALNTDSHDALLYTITGESVKRPTANVGEIPTSSTTIELNRFDRTGSKPLFKKNGKL
jgi:hypothetical protein